jgi:hypothetical protein
MKGLQMLTDALEKEITPIAIECLIKCIEDREEKITK